MRALLMLTLLIVVACGRSGGGGEGRAPEFDKNEKPAGVFRIAFGSCNRERLPQPLWPVIISNQPDLWIWLGDNIYADTEDLALMKSKYDLQKSNEGYQALVKSTRVIGVWDDHDYGDNDAGKEYAKKRESQQLFLDFIDEPKESPRRQQAGVYCSYLFGPEGEQVKVILLDTRYHRDRPGDEGDILGAEQWQWLERELKDSRAQVNIIGSSIQVVPFQHRFEKWANFPRSRARLFALIKATGARGVLFISGDRHFAEISKLDESPTGYPVYDLTSSGLTHSRDRNTVYFTDDNRHRKGEIFADLNFGLIDIEWRKARVKLQVRDRKNKKVLEEIVEFSELTAETQR